MRAVLGIRFSAILRILSNYQRCFVWGIERLHRIVATTRKNALFAGADSGARSWAIFTSLIQSARMSGLNPFEYLKDVLERIVSGDVKAHQLDRLLPWNWKAERAGPTTAQAA